MGCFAFVQRAFIAKVNVLGVSFKNFEAMYVKYLIMHADFLFRHLYTYMQYSKSHRKHRIFLDSGHIIYVTHYG